MTVYYSKGGTSGSELDFHTPSNWNTATNGTGTDATSLSGHDLILQANHYYEVTADATIGSLKTEADSHLKGASGFTIYANGKDGNNYTYDLDGTLDNDNQLNLSVTYAGATNLDVEPQTANYIRNLTLSHASLVATLQRQLVVKDKINIINGELNCGSVNITSELANLEIHKTNSAAKLNYGTNTVTCGRLGESNGGVGKIEGTGDAIAGSGGKIIVQKTGNIRIIDLGSTAVFTGTVVLEYNGNATSTAQDFRPSSGTFDIIVNCDNTTDTVLCNAATNNINNLLITKGIFDPNSSALTVAGTIEVGPDSGAADQAKFNAGASDCTIGSGKTDGVALHVRQGGTADLGSGTHTIGSIAVDNNAAAKFTNTSDTTTLDGNSNDNSRIINIGGSSTCTAAGTMNVTAAAGRLQISNQAGVNNLTLTGNVTYNLHGNSLISNTLTITSGTTLDTQTTSSSGTFRNLTVAGHIFGDGIFTADESTITVAGQITVGTVNLTSGAITSNDDFRPSTKTNIDGNGSITANGSSQIGGLIDIGASNTPTLQAGRLHSTLDIPSGNQGQSTFNLALNENQSNGPARHVFFYNLNLDSEGTENNTYTMQEAITCTGNLTITDGVIDTGSDHALTVGANTDDGGATGHLLILDAGELVCNSSTVIVGSLYCQIAAGSNGTGFAELNLPDSSGSFTVRGPEKNGYVFRLDNQAECNHNSGTITFSLTAENHPSIMDVTSLRGTGVNNILVTQTVSSASSGGVLEFVGSDTVKGNLTLTGNGSESCIVDTNFNGASLTIEGDVTVNNHSTFIKRTTNTGNYSFGGLKLSGGSTFNATSGTTTITNRITGESHLWKNDGGTFNHNNGTVKFNDNDHSAVKENTFYNVEVESNLGDYAVSFEAQGGGGNPFTILNNLTITRGDFELVNANDTLDIHGQTIINGSSNSGARFNNDKNQTGTITHHGLVTIIQGTYHVEDGATVNMAGIRNVGGLVD